MNNENYWKMHVCAKDSYEEMTEHGVVILDAKLLVEAEKAADAIKKAEEYFAPVCPIHTMSVKEVIDNV